jgi:hypothetical protein
MKALRAPNAHFAHLPEYEPSPNCVEINSQQMNYMDAGSA